MITVAPKGKRMKKSMISLIWLGLLSCILLSCGPSAPHQGVQFENSKSIIGENDLVYVPKNLASFRQTAPSEDLLDSIGLIQSGCTATHIGNNIMITAGHCLQAKFFNFHKDISCNKRLTVSWGVRGSYRGYLHSKCVRIIAAENSIERDFALIEVDNAPKDQFNLYTGGEPELNRSMTIYSHPMKRPLQWSKECKNLGRKDLGQWSSNRSYYLNRVHYECDTEGGSSGAAVIDSSTYEILAIHNSGTAFAGDMNKATSIKDILDKLDQEGVTLDL